MLAMLNNRNSTNMKTGCFPELVIGTTANKHLNQYQIELDNNSLLAKKIVKNQIKSCVSFVSH